MRKKNPASQRQVNFWRPALRDKDKKFNFAPKIGWRVLAQSASFSDWRRGWDSGANAPR